MIPLFPKRPEREQNLWDEIFDVEQELLYKLWVLIGAEWEAPTIKAKIISLYEHHQLLQEEYNQMKKNYHKQYTKAEGEQEKQ